MDAKQWNDKLRAPFPTSRVSYLPRITCTTCSAARRSGAACTKHRPAKCAKCGQYISTAHIDLSYIGHADVTDRLLEVDPAWSWEPVAFDPATGLPAIDTVHKGLWIKLTICGVTRYGFGDAGNKTSSFNPGDLVKEMIGDAIRNAAMRFGVGLDLWRKADSTELKAGSTIADDIVTELIVTEPRTTWLAQISAAHTVSDLQEVWKSIVSAKAEETVLPDGVRLVDAVRTRKMLLTDKENSNA